MDSQILIQKDELTEEKLRKLLNKKLLYFSKNIIMIIRNPDHPHKYQFSKKKSYKKQNFKSHMNYILKLLSKFTT